MANLSEDDVASLQRWIIETLDGLGRTDAVLILRSEGQIEVVTTTLGLDNWVEVMGHCIKHAHAEIVKQTTFGKNFENN